MKALIGMEGDWRDVVSQDYKILLHEYAAQYCEILFA